MTAASAAQTNTDLAVDRTVMAADRTLMAWTRTALSMISFGFTIYKVLEAVLSQGTMPARPELPRDAGLFLTGLGTLAVLMGVLEYWGHIRALRQLKRLRLWQPSFVMAVIMCAVGVLLFFSIVFKTL
jgi:putative membrane protein